MARTYHWCVTGLQALAALVVLAGFLLGTGCGGAQQGDCYATAGDGTQQRSGGCFQSNNTADALVAVGVAATATALVGCTVNGCLPPYRCNEATKLCEMIRCDENAPCPAAYSCDLETHRCE